MTSRIAYAASTFTVAFALALSGCPGGGDDDDDDDDDDGPASVEELADAALAYFERCGTFGPAPDAFGTQAEPLLFEAIFAPLLEQLREQFLAQFTSENVIIDEVAAAACIAAIENAGCDDSIEFPECEQAVQGTLAEGDACFSDIECAGTDVTCFGEGQEGCGVCAPRAGVGESCVDRDCEEDLGCDGEVCIVVEDIPDPERPQVGDACAPDGGGCDLFNTGLACVDLGSGPECVVAEVVDVGDACDAPNNGSNESVARYCVNSSSVNFCVTEPAGTTGVCTARPGVGSECLLGVLCDATEAICEDGTCVAGGAEGDTCDNTAPLPCQVGLTCGAESTCDPLFNIEPPITQCE